MNINQIEATDDGTFLYTGGASEFCNLAWSLQRNPSCRVAVRMLRGSKMRTLDALFDEFAAAMQFPYYFSYVYASFDEIINDLEWLNSDRYFIMISDAELMLRDEAEELGTVVKVLQQAAANWGTPEVGNFPRPARGLHIIFQCQLESEREFVSRLVSVGGLQPRKID